jgi:hypothetical protein
MTKNPFHVSRRRSVERKTPIKSAVTRRSFLQTACLAAASGVSYAFPPSHSNFSIGITTNTRGGWEKDLIKSFRESAEVGYRAVETFYSYVLPYWDKPEEMKMILDEFKLRFVTVRTADPWPCSLRMPRWRTALSTSISNWYGGSKALAVPI